MKTLILIAIALGAQGCLEKPETAKRTGFIGIQNSNDNTKADELSQENRVKRVGEISNGNLPPAHPSMGAKKIDEGKGMEEGQEELILRYEAGAELYALHCSSCHGGVETSPKRGANLEGLITAIASDEVMSKIPSLKSISDEDLELIIFALNFAPEDSTKALKYNYEISTGSRHYVYSKFVYLFATNINNIQNPQMLTILDESIKNQASVFGGPCRIIERDEACNIMDLDTAFLQNSATPSPLRAGYIQNSCDRIHALPNNIAINNVLVKINLDTSATINKQNIELLLELFTHQTNFDDAVVTALEGIGTQAAALGMSNAQAWNYISATTCSSTMIDML